MYTVKYSKKAIRSLRKMPRNWAERIRRKINELAKSPYSGRQVKVLEGLCAYRLRVGDWRIIYAINDKTLEMWIIKVASRGEVYK